MDTNSIELTDLAKGLLRASLEDIANTTLPAAEIANRIDGHFDRYLEKVANIERSGQSGAGQREAFETARAFAREVLRISRIESNVSAKAA
ncbi:hypothetical protein CU102_12305 [Phyllobacterium brassicacearum]|uniref:Uncharacterized protein n=1 Tax=Phyllobacterium brassicacearum TaxID=314235 RepID=A0A2P7BQ13_9HYPH|nr:hypothetical protein [Phyllobacterium brassicacearum]PSH68540.1 hypothetical protein CU102_12305 [Phyllobacterium brassicacearum]TDQ19885.1 hypothetical protein DEV91_12480 [Phyllobacterium brassicacearum]